MLTPVVLFLFVAIGAPVHSIAQAWAMAGTTLHASRYVLAWSASALALTLPVLLFLGFPYGIDSAHYNVAWTAIVLSALTTGAAFAIARWRWPPAVLQGLALVGRAWRLLPIHLGVLIVLGPVDMLILSFIFLGNVH